MSNEATVTATATNSTAPATAAAVVAANAPPSTTPPAATAPATADPGTILGTAPAPAPAAAVAVKPPEKYELKLPDKLVAAPGAVERIAALAKQRGLTNDQAQELLVSECSAVSAYAASQQAEYDARAGKWVEEIKADPKFGGDNFGKTAENAKRFAEKFLSPALRKTLDDTGLGNYPDLVKGFAEAYSKMAEDKLVVAGAQAAPTPKRAADLMFGDMLDNKKGEGS